MRHPSFRRRALLSLAFLPLAPAAVGARISTVGVLDVLSAKNSDFLRYLVPGMARLGYVEGKNIRYVFRHLDWDFSKLERFGEELVRLAPDALVTETVRGVRALARNTSRIPIVAACFDPVRNGLTQSLSRPSGNVLGFALSFSETVAKKIEFLRAILPGLQHIAILGKDRQDNSLVTQTVGEVASAQGIGISGWFFRDRDDAVKGLQALKQRRIRAGIDFEVSPGILADEEYANLAIASGVAVAYGASENEKLLLGYEQEGTEVIQWLSTRWPALIDRVLQGTPPSDLPFYAPTRFRLTINLRAASALGLTIPQDILVRADKVIR